jgi:hypothetical protein
MLHAIMVTLKHDSEAVSQLGSRLSPYVIARMAGYSTSPPGRVCGAPPFLLLGQSTDLGRGGRPLRSLGFSWRRRRRHSQPASQPASIEGWMTSSYSKVGIYAG